MDKPYSLFIFLGHNSLAAAEGTGTAQVLFGMQI